MSKDKHKSQVAMAMAKYSIISSNLSTENGIETRDKKGIQNRNLALFQQINRGDGMLDSFESCSRVPSPPYPQKIRINSSPRKQRIRNSSRLGNGIIGHPPIKAQASSESFCHWVSKIRCLFLFSRRTDRYDNNVSGV